MPAENDSTNEGAEDTPPTTSVETAIGPVLVTDEQGLPTPQQFEPVDEQFLENVSALSTKAGPQFVSHYLREILNPQLRHYDEAFALWLDDPESPFDSDAIIWIIGSVFGQACCDGLQMEWTLVTDEFGTDYGVRHKDIELQAFPFSTVGKRVEDRSTGFLMDIFYFLAERIESSDYRSR